jgi:hypothetical protein
MRARNVLNSADPGVRRDRIPLAMPGSAGAWTWPVVQIRGWRLWGEMVTATARAPVWWTHAAWRDAWFPGRCCDRVLGGSGWSGAHWEPERAGWPVQQESTATGADLTGLVRTIWNGDLHRRTAVDVLPVDGMQEVRGSNPLSSTGQKRNSNTSNGEYSSKVQQHGRRYLRPGQPGSGSASRLVAGIAS